MRLLELPTQPGTRLGTRGNRRQEGYYHSPAVHRMGGIVGAEGHTYPRQLVSSHCAPCQYVFDRPFF